MSQGGFLSLRVALTHSDAVRGVVLLGSQAGTEIPEALPHHMALVESWMTHGMSEEIAATLEHIIGGERFVGAPWRIKWAKVTPANLQRIPNNKLVVVAGGGHAANMTHATEVNQAIKEFLATLN